MGLDNFKSLAKNPVPSLFTVTLINALSMLTIPATETVTLADFPAFGNGRLRSPFHPLRHEVGF